MRNEVEYLQTRIRELEAALASERHLRVQAAEDAQRYLEEIQRIRADLRALLDGRGGR